MKVKRILSALLALASLAAASCGGEAPSSSDSTAAPDETTAAVVDPLPERDFEGYEFTFLNGNVVSWFTISTVVPEEQNGETINDAIFTRNSKVEERYNINLVEVASGSAQADYEKSVAADDKAFDVALLRMEWAMPIVLQNAAVNWNDIPHLDLDADWWVQGSIEAMSLMNNIYFGVSLFDTTHFDSVRAMFFNKRLIADLQLENPYELVNSGKWTFAKLHEMGLAAAQDLNGNSEWDKDDRYGITGTSNICGNTLMCGFGSVLSIGKDKDDLPTFDLDNEKSIEQMLTVSKAFGAGDGFLGKYYNDGIFQEGRSLFLCELIYGANAMRDMEDDFGIIPAPKYDESQEEYINLGGSPFFMTVPITNDDLDRTGAVMEALAYDSQELVDVAFYDIVLKGKSSRDNESAAMLDLIFSTLDYYHPLANSYLNAPIADSYLWSGSEEFASYLASVRPKIIAEFESAVATYTANVG